MSKVQSLIDMLVNTQKQAEESLKEVFVEFWEKNPGIKAVVWSQYAPHSNDGDPCDFHVGDAMFTNAEGEDLEEVSGSGYEGETPGVWSDWSYRLDEWKDPSPEGIDVPSTKELSSLIESTVMGTVLQSMFGEEVLVKATRNGFATHDLYSY